MSIGEEAAIGTVTIRQRVGVRVEGVNGIALMLTNEHLVVEMDGAVSHLFAHQGLEYQGSRTGSIVDDLAGAGDLVTIEVPADTEVQGQDIRLAFLEDQLVVCCGNADWSFRCDGLSEVGHGRMLGPVLGGPFGLASREEMFREADGVPMKVYLASDDGELDLQVSRKQIGWFFDQAQAAGYSIHGWRSTDGFYKVRIGGRAG